MECYTIYMKHNDGFTLIEILITITLIGILAAVIITTVDVGRIKGRDASRMQEVDAVKTALGIYYTNNNSFPITTAFSPWNSTTWANGDQAFYTALVPQYISTLPKDPLNSTEGGASNYLGDGSPTDRGFYYTSTDGQSFTLGTNLEKSGLTPTSQGNYVVHEQ
jgi:prepilin-type N-terminal cleavage/methylation domain-containing protein